MTKDINHIKKKWGYERILENNNKYCGKILTVNQGYLSSLHYHKKKDETFIIESGKIQLEVGKAKKTKKGWIVHTKTYMMEPGDKIRLKPNTVHRYKSLTKKSLILEISTQHKDNDSYRIEKSRRE